MRKRITQQDKKIIIYELHQKWAREYLEKLTGALDGIFKYLNITASLDTSNHEDVEILVNTHITFDKYLNLKEEIKLNLRLLEITTREITVIPNKKKENK